MNHRASTNCISKSTTGLLVQRLGRRIVSRRPLQAAGGPPNKEK